MKMMLKTYGLSTLRVAVLGLCAAAMAAPVLAQQQDGPPPPPPGGHMGHDGPEMQARMLKHLTKTLNLTPDQVTQVQAIQADEATKMQALQADTADGGRGKRKQMKAIHEDGVARVRGILTDPQKTQYDTMLAQQKEREQERHEGGQAPPPPPPSA